MPFNLQCCLCGSRCHGGGRGYPAVGIDACFVEYSGFGIGSSSGLFPDGAAQRSAQPGQPPDFDHCGAADAVRRMRADQCFASACMVCSAVYINRTGRQDLYAQVDEFTPPVLSLFFIISGMNLDVLALKTVGIAGIGYFLIRIVGKYAGAYLGCLCIGTEQKIRDWLGLALIPQAGVAIGLAFLGKRVLPESVGDLLLTVILASSVLYELVGPGCAKLALIHSGAIPEEEKGTEPEKAI